MTNKHAYTRGLGMTTPHPEPMPQHTNNTRTGATRRAFARFEARLSQWLARHSIPALRISLGAVFFAFGALKFFPGVSPAEDMVRETVPALTFGIIPAGLGLVLTAVLETFIGLTLLTGRWLRSGLLALGLSMIGIMSPLLLSVPSLFPAPDFAPTLKAQYVVKDLVLVSAGLVVAAKALGAQLVSPRES